MTEAKLEVSAELRQLAENTIDQAEKAFGLFFDAARRSRPATTSAIEFSEQVLAFSQQSLVLSTTFESSQERRDPRPELQLLEWLKPPDG